MKKSKATKPKKDYVSMVMLEIDRYKEKPELVEKGVVVNDDKKGNITVTYKMTCNRIPIEATANNKKEAKRQCYKRIFKEQLIFA